MENGKMAAAALIVGILVFGLSVGFIGGMATKESNSPNDDSDEDIQNDTITQPNLVPTLSMNDVSHSYTSTAFTVNGAVADENPSTVTISVEMINPTDDTDRQGPWTFYSNSQGIWSGVLPITQPSEWVLVGIATDEDGLTSGTIYATAIMPNPAEPEAELKMTFGTPAEDSAWASIFGDVEHSFPSSCAISYEPQGQEAIIGELIGENWTIWFDYNVTNHAGDVIADCGLFTMTRAIVQYTIPELYQETPDADMDGFEDDNDDCDNTPAGEPVHPDGCSDSERDQDGDGVSDADDQCPGHDDNVDVDDDGTPDGCDSLVDSDGDTISDDNDMCPGFDDLEDNDNDNIADGCDDDDDNDGVDDSNDACPSTLPGVVVDSTGCPVITWEPEDSWLCQDGQGPWVMDYNNQNGGVNYGNNKENTNGVSSAGGGGSGPWFQCQLSVSIQNGEMVVDSNGIPNHDFLSTMGCCADEVNLEWHITLDPVNDTSGGHSSTDCPAANGRWECAPARGAVAVAVNGVPIFGPEEGPGGDAVALHFDYFDENRQPIFLGWCTSHSAGNNFHYHYDAQCQFWDAATNEDMSDYEIAKLQSQYHSPIIGWAFDGYPIYGMYGYDDDGQNIRAITSSYTVSASDSHGPGYNGIDDWSYGEGVGDLDECNGRFGPTPEYPEGIYHYVSTPLSGSPTMVTDQSGNDVAMIGFPYFLLCYHGVADVDAQPSIGQGGGGPPPGQTTEGYGFMPENIDWKPPQDGFGTTGWAQIVIELGQTSLILIAFLTVIPKLKSTTLTSLSVVE